MPRYRKFCKEGQSPSVYVGGREFERLFNIKSGFGPKDKNGKMKWWRAWSGIPKEWVPAIEELVNKIRAKYRVETLEDKGAELEIEVWIDQVKDKFGSLRFYFTAKNDKMYDDIDKMVEECEKRLEKDDPYYGMPY